MKDCRTQRFGLGLKLEACLISAFLYGACSFAGSHPGPESLPAPQTGEFLITIKEERIWLDANSAPLGEVLRFIESELGVSVSGIKTNGRLVSGRYSGVSVQRLLRSLNLDYVLTYAMDPESGRHLLIGGSLSGSERTTGSPSLDRRIQALIKDLTDDNVRWNATEAIAELSQIGIPAIPFLEEAMDMGDYQTRQFAASILNRLGDAYAPSQKFLEVLVQGLNDDQYPYGAGTVFLFNARRGLEYFRAHPEQVGRVLPNLASALLSSDGQQRFIAALILAESGVHDQASRFVPILMAHLKDNRLTSDAQNAAYALAKYGEGGRAYFLRALHSEDQQQAIYAQQLLRRLSGEAPSLYSNVPTTNMHNWRKAVWFPNPDGTYLAQGQPVRTSDGKEQRHGSHLHAIQNDSLTDAGPKKESQSPSKLLTYVVVQGDTLADISKLFIVGVDVIEDLNGIEPGTEIRQGQSILIPTGEL